MRALKSLPRFRAMAEQRMLITVELGQYGPWRYDDGADKDVRDLIDSFQTKARIRVRSAQSQRETEAGDRTILGVDRELHVPWNTAPTPNGIMGRVVAIDDTSDPTLLDTEFQVIGPITGDQMTARRLLIREVQS